VIGYVVFSVALAIGIVFAEAPPPGTPSRLTPLHLRMALELSEPLAQQVVQEAQEPPAEEVWTLASSR
jgi:hypothetical protein